MADIKTCRNTNCKYNENGCYCGSYDVEIDENGACADYRPVTTTSST